MSTFVRWFDTLSIADVPLVGGKNASLGEMVRTLTPLGVKIPNGFAITATAYRHILRQTGLDQQLHDLLEGLNKDDVADLARRGRAARELVRSAGIPDDVWAEIRTAYDALCATYGEATDVAVRSSATAEDLPNASFAGQQESYLNISGYAALKDACSRCFASLFTDRAISYRLDQGFAHDQVALSIGVQKMVRSDLASSGVMFTVDTETGFPEAILITGAYGLGENVVQGAVDPDEFYVFKPTLAHGKRPILRKRLGAKQLRMVYAEGGACVHVRNTVVPEDEQQRFCLTDPEILTLARYATTIEEHYSGLAGHWQPMDIEWAKDGQSGELFVVQARPETVQSQRLADTSESYVLDATGPVRITGHSIGQKIGAGTVRVICNLDELDTFQDGEVLVAETTTPDWEPVMKRAAAIITDRGGRTCHAAIVARELGIPAVVGTDGATTTLHTGEPVTVSCAAGEVGKVYSGLLPFHAVTANLADLPRPRTKIQLNVGDPDMAFSLAAIPNDGVGLARLEFIINTLIRIHPMALLHPEKVTDKQALNTIERLTVGYPDKAEYFVDQLAQGVGMIAAAFYPKQVVVRMSDFKSNEYAQLVGGTAFEPCEDNPMIGFRGASRYSHPAYAEAFALECQAMKRVRDTMGLTNVVLMIPFCRRVEEGERVLAEMANQGLVRGDNGLQVYVMCEIPNNVIRIDAFCQIFDGISIGSNDLTQLTLGVDRDSSLVAFDFDERDPGVKAMLQLAIEGAHRNDRHVGICGQAPSDYPEMAAFLVDLGIDALSLNPDTVLTTTMRVVEQERQHHGAPHGDMIVSRI